MPESLAKGASEMEGGIDLFRELLPDVSEERKISTSAATTMMQLVVRDSMCTTQEFAELWQRAFAMAEATVEPEKAGKLSD